MRIVSLLGSATEMVHELGLQRYLVGISHECDHPVDALSLPRVSRPRFDPSGLTSGQIDAAVRRAMEAYGSVYEVDRELLRRLRPTHVLTQGLCEVCAVSTGSIEEAIAELPQRVEVIPLDAHRLEEILTLMETLSVALGGGPPAELVVRRLRERVGAVRFRTVDAPTPDVLLLEWLDPPFGPGHWVPEMVEAAGGRCLLGEAGHPSREIDWSALGRMDPDILLVEPCGFDLEAGLADADRHRERLRSIAGRAVREGRAWVLHSAWFSRSGPRVVEGIETLASLFHPDRFPGHAADGRALPWR